MCKYLSETIDIKNSIFIFKSCNWSTILECFYKFGLEVSGGSGVKRHIVSPMDYTLSLFLNLFSENGYKDTVTSTNLVDKCIYDSKFTKSTECIYNNDLFKKILIKILSSLERAVYNYNSYLTFNNLSEDSLLLHKAQLKQFILNELILTDSVIVIRDFFLIFKLNLLYLLIYLV